MSVFLSIMAGSILFFVLVWLLGLGHDGDHDVGHFHDGSGGDLHHGDTSDHHDILRVFSIRNFALFGMGFGGAGAIATKVGYTTAGASVWGVSSGAIIVWIILMLYRALYSQQASTTSDLMELRGRMGRVSVRIPEDGIGEIQILNEYGVMTAVTAESISGEIGVGRSVFVHDIVGGHVQVGCDN